MTSLTGAGIGPDLTAADKTWGMFRAIGNKAFACSYMQILIEIQDTLKSSPPEIEVMKKANVIATLTATTLYMLCGCFGYAALGNHAPGNILAGTRWPKSKFVMDEYPLSMGKNTIHFSFNLFRLNWRTIFVVMAALLSMALPFFNEVLALLGALAYWPLTVYFPLEMYIARKKIKKGTSRWLGLQLLNLVLFLSALAAAASSIQGFNQALHTYKPFKFTQ